MQGSQRPPDLQRLERCLADLDVLPERHPPVPADVGTRIDFLRRRDDRGDPFGEERPDIDLPRQPRVRIGMQDHGAAHDPGHDRARPQMDDHVAASPDRDGVGYPKPLLGRYCDSSRDRASDDRRVHGRR